MHINVDDITPLHLACYNGSLQLVKLLIKNGAKMNGKDSDGDTPLAMAVYQYAENKYNYIQFLLTKQCLSLYTHFDRKQFAAKQNLWLLQNVNR